MATLQSMLQSVPGWGIVPFCVPLGLRIGRLVGNPGAYAWAGGGGGGGMVQLNQNTPKRLISE